MLRCSPNAAAHKLSHCFEGAPTLRHISPDAIEKVPLNCFVTAPEMVRMCNKIVSQVPGRYYTSSSKLLRRHPDVALHMHQRCSARGALQFRRCLTLPSRFPDAAEQKTDAAAQLP
jgi:hypothetical protein